MVTRQSKADALFGSSLLASTVIHLAVFLLLVWYGRLFPAQINLQETYYVDVVNLPVAAPRAGSPVQRGNAAEAPPPPAPTSRMTMPAPPKPKSASKPAQPQKTVEKSKPAAESSSEFAERMAKLERKAESQQEEAVLERLRRKVTATGSGRSGMPGAGGSEAGSDYSAYIQSRLKDAFRETISYTSKSPEVVIQLQIGSDGRISRKKIERSSGDRAFELATLRAIDMASEKFTPPPNHKVFEAVFVFRPQGISNSKP